MTFIRYILVFAACIYSGVQVIAQANYNYDSLVAAIQDYKKRTQLNLNVD